MRKIPVHYMQSPAYAKFMEKLGWEVCEVANTHTNLYAYGKKIPLLGSLLKIPRSPLPLDMSPIDRLAKSKRALFTKLEPNAVFETELTNLPIEYMSDPEFELVPEHAKKDSPVAQTKTIVVDLTPIPEKIEKRFKTDVRTSLRHAAANNLIALESKNIDEFYALFEVLAKERGFYYPFSKQMHYLYNAFNENAKIIMTYRSPREKNPEPLAGCFLILHDGVAYYKYAASLPEGRKIGAPYLTLWKAMLLAKKAGCKVIDLEGITDERYPETKKYKGITHFKQSWGGTTLTYLGSYAKSYSTIYSFLSTIARAFSR